MRESYRIFEERDQWLFKRNDRQKQIDLRQQCFIYEFGKKSRYHVLQIRIT